MGITLKRLDELRARGLLSPGSSILDIGSSNLYKAEKTATREFLAHYGVRPDDAFVDHLEKGSAYGPNGGTNDVFVGELLELAGLKYLAFDIANGYRTRVFDLNSEILPDDLKGTFDTVLNFGTTEHVFNQLNAFRVIHDAARPGGHIIHELPSVGFIDHGFFCYTPRFLFDLSGHNEYEVIDFAYHGPAIGKDILGIVRDYQSYFPALSKFLVRKDEERSFFSRFKRVKHPPNIVAYIVLKKVKDLPLRLPMETSTSVVRAVAG